MSTLPPNSAVSTDASGLQFLREYVGAGWLLVMVILTVSWTVLGRANSVLAPRGACRYVSLAAMLARGTTQR